MGFPQPTGILGHRDRSTTAIYAKVTLTLQREELSKLHLDLDMGKVITLPLAVVGGTAQPQEGHIPDGDEDAVLPEVQCEVIG